MKNEINLNGKLNTNMLDELTNKKINTNLNIYISRQNTNKYKSSTIYFKDMTDETNFKNIKQKLKNELKKYILKTDYYLLIGIGNKNSNMDSLGPKTLNNILTTKHLLKYGLNKKYKIVSKFVPDVEANTGIETYKLIKNVIKEEKPNQVIIVDSLISNNFNNISKCIQISNAGINKLFKNNIKIPIIIIGIPTIIETDKENIIITTKDIDKFIEKASLLIGSAINEVIHSYSDTKVAPE